MVLRFGISHPADFPHVRLSEDDEFPSGGIKQAYIKWAQSMAGALLRLITRTRLNIAMTASACRLATKNLCKSMDILSKAIKQYWYVLGVQGGAYICLHYPRGVPQEDLGQKRTAAH